jgi:hypothetical protein
MSDSLASAYVDIVPRIDRQLFKDAAGAAFDAMIRGIVRELVREELLKLADQPMISRETIEELYGPRPDAGG